MSSRDKFGHYINEQGVIFEVHTDKNGKVHFNAYDGPLDGPHTTVHFNADLEKREFNSNCHDENGNPDPDNGNNHSCFLTTACIKVLSEHFDNNCHELQILRWFRDHHVSEKDVAHYYRVAPAIVAAIDSREDRETIYADLYHQVVRPCVLAIERSRYDTAYRRYRQAVLNLEQEYLTNS